MYSKVTKTALQFMMSVLMLTVIVTACNNKKDEKKEEPAKDTTTAPAPTPSTGDTTKVPDSADTKPVKTPD